MGVDGYVFRSTVEGYLTGDYADMSGVSNGSNELSCRRELQCDNELTRLTLASMQYGDVDAIKTSHNLQWESNTY